MEINSRLILLLGLLFLFCMVSFSHGKRLKPRFRLKAVNLGGWLVAEGYITPSLLDGIPNKDLLDGSQILFKSVATGKYLCAETGGGTIIVANRTVGSGWETFILWRINEKTFNFKVFNRQFVGLDMTNGNGVDVVAIADTPGKSETFEIVRKPGNSSRVRIKAPNGFFLQVKAKGVVTADFAGKSKWEKNDPSVFEITNIGGLNGGGEFQLTNGYGPERAPQVMREHWNTFIVEDDFKFIAENGLNGVRIPVGWWIASDPTPPYPYVGGSLEALDNAFSWAEKYGIKIVLGLHALPGCQNGWVHGGSRDGTQDWGKTDDTIQQSVDAIDFLTARYAKSPSFYAMELMNEPKAPEATLEMLNKFYMLGYDAVRKHSSTVYVVLNNRIGKIDERELFPLASGLKGIVLDLHYYNLFNTKYYNLTAQQNIDFIYGNRSRDIDYVTTSNGPLVFIGEWGAEWLVEGASQEDYKRYIKALLDVFKRASFGWAFWSLKNVNNHWNMEWLIKNGYIKL
ncbi:hypothetical protein F2P56_035086 [Juglans regia]|uniref:Mannan endo-1,4-beta-mannosidase n=2 Tax=Juglans regia TaxID=51240 RepID=A0A833TST7_JUGRE|nr:probable glucan 1,3-beta-glucosidase A [Juglans regia]KAF5442428.1 hypothetical protein F2P56_035086 [Juglans regia]